MSPQRIILAFAVVVNKGVSAAFSASCMPHDARACAADGMGRIQIELKSE